MTDISWQELLSIAVQMEEHGRRFYEQLADRASNPQTAEVLRRLALDEQEHAAVFRHGFPAVQVRVLPVEAGYMQALHHSGLDLLSPQALQDPRQAIALAIQTEKDAILYYTELGRMIQDEKAKEVLYKVLREEKLHLVTLREHLDEDFS